MLKITGGVIHDSVHKEPYKADILIDNGKIIRIGKNIDAQCEAFDAEGLEIRPGFIDAHTHIGMFGYGGKSGITKDDVEKYAKCTPENRGIDCINPMEETFREAREAGVTCVCTGPGSVNCIGGTHIVMKTAGIRVDKMIVKNPAAMKIAFGENPKTTLMSKLTTRMTVAAEIRAALYKAREYMLKKEAAGDDPAKLPAWNAGYEELIPVLKKQIPLKAHAHRADDIFSAIRIAKELDVDLTLEHATESALIADELAEEKYSVALGPYLSQVTKDENRNKDPRSAVMLLDRGVNVCVMTDSPIIAEENLPLCAGYLMRYGLDEFRALQTVTINAAKHLGVQDRVGSIEEGKDADLVLSKGCPFSMTVRAEHVFIDGIQIK